MDDYIKREQALKLIESGGTWGWSKNALYDEMKNLPAADVAPVVHAKWITAPHKSSRFCSKCYHDEPYKFADSNANIYNYCPHCGAKMDFEENPND